MDDTSRYRAVQSRDSRFDGAFITAVTTTGIYCRPSCPARTPSAANVRFYRSAAAAQGAGFRACKRCRPDATPGSPEWNIRADLAGRALRLIADGLVDREGVGALASLLGYSERHLHRVLVAEVGAGPLALARAQRAQTSRVLLETTDLPISAVAFAAGFASIRQFNGTIRDVFALTPTQLRNARSRHGDAAHAATAGLLTLRLPYRAPFPAAALLAFLGRRAVAGVESFADSSYSRSMALPHGPGVVTLSPGEGFVRCHLQLTDLRDLGACVQRCRRLLDLDADPVAIDTVLGGDPLLAPLVARLPGRRVPGCPDGDELAVRAVLGQQVSVAGARTVAGRLVARFGKPLTSPSGAVTHLFPSAAALAGADPGDLPMPASRQRALLGLCTALAEGSLRLDPGADRDEVAARLLALPGIGPWTSGLVRMRALGDPDLFLPGDLGVRQALARLGEPQAAALTRAQRWRPWRSYAVQLLWAGLQLAPGDPA